MRVSGVRTSSYSTVFLAAASDGSKGGGWLQESAFYTGFGEFKLKGLGA